MRFLNVFLCVHKNLCLNSKSVSNACSLENILTPLTFFWNMKRTISPSPSPWWSRSRSRWRGWRTRWGCGPAPRPPSGGPAPDPIRRSSEKDIWAKKVQQSLVKKRLGWGSCRWTIGPVERGVWPGIAWGGGVSTVPSWDGWVPSISVSVFRIYNCASSDIG